MRVVIADDNLLVRQGIAAVLRGAGIEVVAQAEAAEELLRAVAEHLPEVAIVDIRMPPTHTDEGLRAASEIRRRHPGVGIVILSQHVEIGVGARALAESPERLGYLLKDRVSDIGEFVETLRRVAAGGTALDPFIVSGLLSGVHRDSPVQTLTERERAVLELMAEGRSNRGIGERLDISERAVQKHITAIFAKLGLPAGADDNRRVLAVMAYLRPDITPAAGTR